MGKMPETYDDELDERQLKKLAKKRAKEIREFYSHLWSYLSVNVMLFFVDLFTGGGLSWFYWVAFFWGIGLVNHAMSVFKEIKFQPMADRVVEREMKRVMRKKVNNAKQQIHIKAGEAKTRNRPFIEKLKDSIDSDTITSVGQEISKAMKELEKELGDMGISWGSDTKKQTETDAPPQTNIDTPTPPQPASKIPQGVAILMFTDMEGFSSYAERFGDDEAHRLLKLHHRLVRKSVDVHDGIEVKSMGDGFMLCFISAKKALMCATDVQQQLEEAQFPLRVRIGLHAGEPIQSGEDLTGHTVNLAARVMDQANGGQIMITEVVRTLAGPIKDFQYVDQGQRRLPGLSEPHQLYEFSPVASLISPLDTEVDSRLEKMEKYLGRE